MWRWCQESTLQTARRSNQSIRGDESCVFNGRTDAEAETPILWSPNGKGPDVGKE